MQYVLRLSALTYEWTQFTPTSALRSTTMRQTAAPSSVTGICSPSGKVRSTRYRGMKFPSVLFVLLSSSTSVHLRGIEMSIRHHAPFCYAQPPFAPTVDLHRLRSRRTP